MKVLLINADTNRNNAYSTIGFILPPLGLLYVVAHLKKAGHDITLIDQAIEDEFYKIDYSPYDLVGISGDTPRHNQLMKISKEAKKAGKVVIAGGPHVTFEDEDCLLSGYIDYVVRAEGELTIVDLVNAIEQNGDQFNRENIQGISWLDQDGKIQRTPDRPFLKDIDKFLLPARELIDMSKYRKTQLLGRPVSSLITSRGCPHNCIFCSSTRMSGRQYRVRNPYKVADEIEILVKEYGFGAISFMDDNLTVNKDRVSIIMDEIIKRKLDILFWCTSRADQLVNNEDMIAKMAKAGCNYIFLGLESPVDKVLKEMNKRTSVDAGERAVKLLSKYGINTMASFVIGSLNETKEDIEATIQYSIKLNPATAQFCIMTPYPGAKIYDDYKNRITTNNWELYDSTNAVMKTNYFEPEELQKYIKNCYMRFYFRPERILRYLSSYLIGGKLKFHTVKSLINSIR